jgi:hypothetical protein
MASPKESREKESVRQKDSGTVQSQGSSESPSAASVYADADRPDHDEIAILAYGIYLDRGGQAGNEVDDWLQAEQALLRRRAAGQRDGGAPRSKSTSA